MKFNKGKRCGRCRARMSHATWNRLDGWCRACVAWAARFPLSSTYHGSPDPVSPAWDQRQHPDYRHKLLGT